MLAVLYARYSPTARAQTGTIEAQLAEMRRFCAARGWTIAGEYTDQRLSGGNRRRPGLQAAVNALSPRHVLVVAELDRLARDVRIGFDILDQVSAAGAQLASLDSGGVIADTDEAWLSWTIRMAVSEYMRRSNAKRTSKRMLEYQRNGRAMGRKPPYGFRKDGKRLVPAPAEQDTLEVMLSLAHEPPASIAAFLNAEGRLPRSGNWTALMVRRILERHSASRGGDRTVCATDSST